MKFSVNWLREFVELPANIDELANLLTLAGVEIEGIEKRGAAFDNVVVAQITASSPHPNADRLSVCQVDDGSGQPRQIVCGAKNYKVDDKVPLARPGAILPNDLKIRASKLRGVDSEGMLCSAKELALAEDAAGLLILSPEARVGAPIETLFPADTILDVEITPNRGDLLSHFGLAREIAALTGVDVIPPKIEALPPATAATTGVRIRATRECPFYSARRIENIVMGPSPEWLRAKTEAVGIRSINNIVDITNYVMLELGQPLHAFDADKLQGGINVRLAQSGEKFLALDGKTYSLGKNDLVIADDARAVGIAGVMGGEDTGVSAGTRNLLLESAYFLPASIRRTARGLNLPSDASYRFERGVDPGMILAASARASQLIQELAAGHPVAEIARAGSLPPPPAPVQLRYARCSQLLGDAIEPKTVDDILERFGLRKAAENFWEIPGYRRDLVREVDLIEEVVRVHGIDRIPSRERSRFTASSEADKTHDFEAKLRFKLAARGLNEARTSKLIARNAPAFSEGAKALRNPLSEDHVALRPSLIGGLIDVLALNIRASAQRVAIFEIGRVFVPTREREEPRIGILLWGNAASEVHWRTGKGKLDFFDLKGAVEFVLPRKLSFRRSFHRNLSLAAEIFADNELIGIAGQLSASLASKIDAPGGVFVAELSMDLQWDGLGSTATFREFGKFPAISRDIAMIAPDSLTHEKVIETILAEPLSEHVLEKIAFFDQFVGEEATKRFGPGRKSLAYTLTYRDKNRTLTTDEVTVVHARIRERLQRELAVELRE